MADTADITAALVLARVSRLVVEFIDDYADFVRIARADRRIVATFNRS